MNSNFNLSLKNLDEINNKTYAQKIEIVQNSFNSVEKYTDFYQIITSKNSPQIINVIADNKIKFLWTGIKCFSRIYGFTEILTTFRDNRLKTFMLVASETIRFALQITAPLAITSMISAVIATGGIAVLPLTFGISAIALATALNIKSRNLVKSFREIYTEKFYDKSVNPLEESAFVNYTLLTQNIVSKDVIKKEISGNFNFWFPYINSAYYVFLNIVVAGTIFIFFQPALYPVLAVQALLFIGTSLPKIFKFIGSALKILSNYTWQDIKGILKLVWNAPKIIPLLFSGFSLAYYTINSNGLLNFLASDKSEIIIQENSSLIDKIEAIYVTIFGNKVFNDIFYDYAIKHHLKSEDLDLIIKDINKLIKDGNGKVILDNLMKLLPVDKILELNAKYINQDTSKNLVDLKNEIANICNNLNKTSLNSFKTNITNIINKTDYPYLERHKDLIIDAISNYKTIIDKVPEIITFGIENYNLYNNLNIWKIQAIKHEKEAISSNQKKNDTNILENKQSKTYLMNKSINDNKIKELKKIKNQNLIVRKIGSIFNKFAEILTNFGIMTSSLLSFSIGIIPVDFFVGTLISDFFINKTRNNDQILNPKKYNQDKVGSIHNNTSLMFALELSQSHLIQKKYHGKRNIVDKADSLLKFHSGLKIGVPKKNANLIATTNDSILSRFNYLQSLNNNNPNQIMQDSNVIINLDNSLEVKSGDIIIFKGETGSGKTTMLLATELWPLFSGSIDISNIAKESIAVVPQKGIAIMNNLSFTDFITYGMKPEVLNKYKNNDGTINKELLLNRCRKEMIKLGFDQKHYCNLFKNDPLDSNISASLSGGESVRMTILRMIMQENKIIILDESLSHLGKTSANENIASLYRSFCIFFDETYDQNYENYLSGLKSIKQVNEDIFNKFEAKIDNSKLCDFLHSRSTPTRNIVQKRLKEYVNENQAAVISVQHDDNFNTYEEFGNKEWNITNSNIIETSIQHHEIKSSVSSLAC